MARPLKYNAEYFSHDNAMRNDPRIKALRKKCGLQGYAIYNMILEFLIQSEFIQIELNDLNIEIMAGDFDIEEKQMNDVLDYCIKLDLIQLNSNLLRCKQLDKRLEPVFAKRKLVLDDLRGITVTETPPKLPETSHSVTEIPIKSKVKERKLNQSKVKKDIPSENEIELRKWCWDQSDWYHKEIQKLFPNIKIMQNSKISDTIDRGAEVLRKLHTIDNKPLDEIEKVLQFIIRNNSKKFSWVRNIQSLSSIRNEMSNNLMKYEGVVLSIEDDNQIKLSDFKKYISGFYRGYCFKCGETDSYDKFEIWQESRCHKAKLMTARKDCDNIYQQVVDKIEVE